MSQQDIFKKAIAAKLSGDEAGFKAAISEAIKSKAKQMIAESRFQRGPGIEQVDDNWYLVTAPIQVADGAANVPAGQYNLSIQIASGNDSDSAWADIVTVEVHPLESDEIVATLQGQEAQSFVDSFVPEQIRSFLDDRGHDSYAAGAERRNDDNMADMGAERQQAQRAGF